MTEKSDIEMSIWHVRLHKQAYADLERTREAATQAQVYLRMKRGEMAQRFANHLDKPATRQRGRKKASEGPLTPIPLTVGEQMLLEFQMGILDFQEVQAANMEIMHLEATERYRNLVAIMEKKLDEGWDTEVRDFYNMFRVGPVGDGGGDGDGGGGEDMVGVRGGAGGEVRENQVGSSPSHWQRQKSPRVEVEVVVVVRASLRQEVKVPVREGWQGESGLNRLSLQKGSLTVTLRGRLRGEEGRGLGKAVDLAPF